MSIIVLDKIIISIKTQKLQAGLCDAESADRLLIALEPEAAAVQCREQLLQENPALARKLNLTANSLNSRWIFVPVKKYNETNSVSNYK